MNKLLSIILILTILGAVAVAPVVADEHAVGADLHIVQESYVASDVEVTDSETGLPIYEVEGGQVVIHTQNFDSDGVESWGVVEDDASMTKMNLLLMRCLTRMMTVSGWLTPLRQPLTPL